MASRSYLYACNEIPGASDTPEKHLTGLSESNYDIPLAYKVLLAPNPATCRSRIWHSEKALAIVGDYDAGVAELTMFLKNITLAQLQPAIEDTLAFLHNPNNRSRYLLLECAEIFDLRGPELDIQNAQLAEDIQSLDDLKQIAITTLNAQTSNTQTSNTQTGNTQTSSAKKRRFGFLSRKAQSTDDTERALSAAAEFGLYAWTNHLTFDFS